jgi:PAS domain S-box-containing protein
MMKDVDMREGLGQPRPIRANFPAAGTPTATLLHGHDWAASALGAPGTWPCALQATVSMMVDSPLAMWLGWGEALSMVYNEPYARILGGKHPRAMGSPVQRVWAEIWPDVGPLIHTALSGEAVLREDLPLLVNRHGHEEATWFSFSYSPLRDDEGMVCGMICTVWETTEKVMAQRRLAEIDERYRLVAQATNDAVWDWRLSDGQVIWNQALASLFGHALVQSQAGWWLDHIHPDDRARIEVSIHACIDGEGSAWSGEYRFRRADGSYADILDRGTVLRDAAGQPMRMIGAMLDLSERKASEAALRESERRFRTLFESIDEGFCVIEFLDGPHGPLSDYVHVSANPAYLANAGIANVVGQRVRDMLPLEADGWVATFRDVLLTGAPVRFERELVRTRRHLELAAFRIDPSERRQVAVLFQDVTPRRRAELALRELNDSLERRVADEVAERLKTEAALRQAQKMEAVGQLTGGIAHDFNNMLAVVIGSLDLLDRRFVAQDARAKRHVVAARDAARRAAQLTQRLLAFSRQQPLRPEPLDANKLVAGMSDLLRRSLGGAVQLETVLAGGLWRTHADPNQLENVILNLAVNGRDAMPDGGRLTIETANYHLDERYAAGQPGLAPGPYVQIAVSDTGAGMAPEVVDRAFDPFFTTKEVGRGTGLGLSQVYGFVKQTGGHVKIYSEVGAGTVVKVYLPRLLATQEVTGTSVNAAPLAQMPLGDGHELILVVEDEPAVRQLSIDALTELGYQVLQADGAAAALQLLKAHPAIDLLFTDVVMPEVNGRKLADQALLLRPHLKVLFTTGYARSAVVHNGVLKAGVHLIGKPYTLDDLAMRVRQVLDEPAHAGDREAN